jgi:Domain of unknown function (DUF6265)
MKNNFTLRLGIIAFWIALFFPGPTNAADRKKPAPPPAIAKLAWLAGSWRGEKNSRLTDEAWMAPGGGVMLGMGRTLVKGKVVEHEFLQIREGPGGVLFYIAQTSGQKEAAFQVVSLTDTTVTFQNQLQDFPQTVSYALQADGSLLVAFEGPGPDGQLKRVENSYQRTER